MNQSIYYRYLDALRISKSKPSLEALTKIIKAHLKYVPFENISKIYYLNNLDIKSIPINILTPIPGTPLAELQPPSLQDVLTTIALFRFINPDAVIRMAGGRQQLGSEQYRCFAAGANGSIVGNYLTTTGSSIAHDLKQLQAMGFTFSRAGKR